MIYFHILSLPLSFFPKNSQIFSALFSGVSSSSGRISLLLMVPLPSTSYRAKAHSSFCRVLPPDVRCRATMYSLKSKVPSALVSKLRNTCRAYSVGSALGKKLA
ncbi:hypothetical protein EYF80_036933 [Liparis tanakae]|uniref:Uncharacterized protein n=1 Tax=Liparis tanakae TaxID=230148 RepID=A0A4Z2GIY7_9TELE|nr:hypothetical protein EYF80_036933 [Liparis tanakae]